MSKGVITFSNKCVQGGNNRGGLLMSWVRGMVANAILICP